MKRQREMCPFIDSHNIRQQVMSFRPPAIQWQTAHAHYEWIYSAIRADDGAHLKAMASLNSFHLHFDIHIHELDGFLQYAAEKNKTRAFIGLLSHRMSQAHLPVNFLAIAIKNHNHELIRFLLSLTDKWRVPLHKVYPGMADGALYIAWSNKNWSTLELLRRIDKHKDPERYRIIRLLDQELKNSVGPFH